MTDGTAKLIAQTYTVDSIGQRVPTETQREVFVSVSAVTRAEWQAATDRGLQPTMTMYMPSVNYAGEKLVEYGGKRYDVYRTYDNGEEVELYLEEKAGVN